MVASLQPFSPALPSLPALLPHQQQPQQPHAAVAAPAFLPPAAAAGGDVVSIGTHEQQVRFVRLYFLYSNAVLPMVCKTNFYYGGLRWQLYHLIASLCEDTRPVCDHAAGDCATMTFWPLAGGAAPLSAAGPGSSAPAALAHATGTAPSASASAGPTLGKRSAAAMDMETGVHPSAESSAASSSLAATERGGRSSRIRNVASKNAKPVSPVSKNEHQPSDNDARTSIAGGARASPPITSGSSSGSGTSGFLPAPRGFARASPELIAAHLQQMPPAMQTGRATAPKVLAACQACYYGVLAIGARMDMQHAMADAYIERAHAALARCFDEPCLETISALTLVGYYTCGVCVSGDFLRAKLYIALANEMADGLEMSAAAARRRSTQNTFSTDRQLAAGAAAAEGASAGAQGVAQSNNARRAGNNMAGLDPASDPRAGVPVDVLLAVRFLAQMTSAYRSGAGLALPSVRAEADFESPRGKVSRLLAYVTQKTRRRVTSPAEMKRIAGELLVALNDADAIEAQYHAGGPMSFCTQAAIHTSRAVVLHAVGETRGALQYVDRALAAMDNNLRQFASFITSSVLVQLIPVCFAGGRRDTVQTIMGYLQDLSRMWPVGNILVAKAQRRIEYCSRSAAGSALGGGAVTTHGTALPQPSQLAFERAAMAASSNVLATSSAAAAASAPVTAHAASAGGGARAASSDGDRSLHLLASVTDVFGGETAEIEPLSRTGSAARDAPRSGSGRYAHGEGLSVAAGGSGVTAATLSAAGGGQASSYSAGLLPGVALPPETGAVQVQHSHAAAVPPSSLHALAAPVVPSYGAASGTGPALGLPRGSSTGGNGGDVPLSPSRSESSLPLSSAWVPGAAGSAGVADPGEYLDLGGDDFLGFDNMPLPSPLGTPVLSGAADALAGGVLYGADGGAGMESLYGGGGAGDGFADATGAPFAAAVKGSGTVGSAGVGGTVMMGLGGTPFF